ncbi:MAG: cellulose biosynthesis cyclic di-GMP-binding regulatory protein BcsB [Paenibacillus sp.]|jgi:hypothetical protein|nr:cellulose biosynthesis cyclic di-GMP-binding regulatory protein BcsB [Paenibacillus sp.]
MIKPNLSVLLVIILLFHTAYMPFVNAEPAAMNPQNAVVSTESNSSVVVPSTASPKDDVENLYFLQENLVIQGVTNRQDYYFEVSPSRKIEKGSYFHLFFGHSPTLLPLKSTMTVLLDDLPLGSQFLDEKNRENSSWKLNFPDMDLKPGFHKVSILTHMEATSNLCEDQNNPANWTLFHKESVIHLNMKKSYDSADLSYYPSPFLEKGSVSPLKTIFILPDDPDEGQLKALSQLSAHFAGLASSDLLEFKVYKESELTENVLKSSHQIWIGDKEHWNETGRKLVEELQKKHSEVSGGSLGVQQSLWNRSNTVMTLVGNTAQIQNGINILTDKNLYSQLVGDYVDLSQVPMSKSQQVSTNKTGSNMVTLASMGYNDLIVESPLVGATRISYAIPPEWDVYKGAKLKLQFRHTKTLNFTQSLLTVKVNNVPLNSKYLNEESSDFGSLEIEIPQQLLSNGIINIDIGFQFSSSKESCSGNSQIGNWAVVSKESFLSFSYRLNRSVDLSNLPYPFVLKSSWNNTAFLLEDSPSSEALSLLATISGMIGKNAASPDELSVYKAAQAGAQVGKNLIYVGNTKGIPEVVNQSKFIPVRVSNGLLSSANPKIEMLKSSSEHTGIIELFPFAEKSPYVMIVAATDNDTMKRMNSLLNNPMERNKMTGQVVLIDSINRIHTYLIEQKVDEPSEWDQALDLLTPNNKPVVSRVIIIAGTVVILIFTALLVWFIRRRKK